MKKICQYSKCGKEFTPNKPRQQYCSDIHRVYANREKKGGKPEKPPEKKAAVKPAKKAPTQSAVEKNEAPPPVTRPKNLDQLKALCPKELTGFDRSNWISQERQKYGI